MIVRQHVALCADQYPGTQAGLYFLACLGKAIAKELLEDRVFQQRVYAVGDQLGGMNVDHRRDGLFNGIGVGDRAIPAAAARVRAGGRVGVFHGLADFYNPAVIM